MKKQLRGIMTRLDIPLVTCKGRNGSYDTNTIRMALTNAMYMQVAYLQRQGESHLHIELLWKRSCFDAFAFTSESTS